MKEYLELIRFCIWAPTPRDISNEDQLFHTAISLGSRQEHLSREYCAHLVNNSHNLFVQFGAAELQPLLSWIYFM